jgi:hypothetical protein
MNITIYLDSIDIKKVIISKNKEVILECPNDLNITFTNTALIYISEMFQKEKDKFYKTNEEIFID